jgi:hypothetical protein
MTDGIFSTTELSLANAIAHDALGFYCQRIYIGCERCGNPNMLVADYTQEPPENHMEDIIITARYFLKCPCCGFEEADQIITIIPSWQWHPVRNRLPQTGAEVFKDKINLVRTWLGRGLIE